MDGKENMKMKVSMKDNESEAPVSWPTLYCRLFAHLAKAVVDKFGEDGRQAIREGVRTFGEERGRNIEGKGKWL